MSTINDIQNPNLKLESSQVLFSTLEKVRFDYKTFIQMVCCSNNLSSCPSTADMKSFKDEDEQSFLKFIEADCRAKLDDVRKTNNACASVSAFMSIVALIGFLAKLAFHKNSDFIGCLPQKHGRQIGLDSASYIEFVNRFILGEKDKNKYQRRDGLGEVLYKMVRCGLLHGETVSSEAVQNVRVYISHAKGTDKTLSRIDAELTGRSTVVPVVFNATVLCDAINDAITSMMETKDVYVQESIKSVYEEEPPVVFIDEKNEEFE